ncbi:MAG: hypothetical protein ACRDUV_24845 [Pseudonocardiaceae bacterium]
MSPSARPAVVFLTHHLPWPARSGGRVWEGQLLQRLSARFDIEVVAVSKVPEFDRRHVEEAIRHGVHARIFAAQAMEQDHVGPLTRRHAAPAARDYLAYRLRQPAMVVHVEGHYLLGLVPERVRPAVLLVEHNIESALFEQRAAQCPAPAERATLLREGARTRSDELTAWRRVRIVGQSPTKTRTRSAPQCPTRTCGAYPMALTTSARYRARQTQPSVSPPACCSSLTWDTSRICTPPVCFSRRSFPRFCAAALTQPWRSWGLIHLHGW